MYDMVSTADADYFKIGIRENRNMIVAKNDIPYLVKMVMDLSQKEIDLLVPDLAEKEDGDYICISASDIRSQFYRNINKYSGDPIGLGALFA